MEPWNLPDTALCLRVTESVRGTASSFAFEMVWWRKGDAVAILQAI